MDENISVTLIKEVLKKFKKHHSTFIETGTYLGGAVSLALECGFELIYSVDISKSHETRNKHLFKKEIALGKVKLLYGDSIDVLPNVIKETEGVSSVFWLDAHFDVFSDVCGKYKTPILYELDCILKSKLKNHTIFIDDIRMFRDNKEWAISISLQDIISKIKEINSNYHISYEDGRDDNSFRKDDVLVAYV